MKNNNKLLEERRILKTEIKDIEIELRYKQKKLQDIEERLRNDEGNSLRTSYSIAEPDDIE